MTDLCICYIFKWREI